MQFSHQMEGVAAAHHDHLGLVDQSHRIFRRVHGHNLLFELVEHLLHACRVGVIALGIDLATHIHARVRHKHDFGSGFLDEFLDERGTPAQIGLFVIG